MAIQFSKARKAFPRYLYNRDDLPTLKLKLQSEAAPRVTLSFYQYTDIEDPQKLRDELFLEWQQLRVLGRIYVAKEGINAQLSVPEVNFEVFKTSVWKVFPSMIFKRAVEENRESFYKLIIKVKPKIVADGLPDGTFDAS